MEGEQAHKMITAKVNASALNAAISYWVANTKDDLDDTIKKQAAMIVGSVIAITPPAKSTARDFSFGRGGGITKEAKQRGEIAIASDAHVLFPTVSPKTKAEEVWAMIQNGHRWGTGRGAKKIPQYAETVADLQRVHEAARSPRTGRIRTGTIGQNMALTKKGIRAQFIKMQKKKVGILAAGWLKAAYALKTARGNLPVWIRRHSNSPGGVRINSSRFGISVTASNKVPYFPSDMDSRVQVAINKRTKDIYVAISKMMERQAKKFNKRQK